MFILHVHVNSYQPLAPCRLPPLLSIPPPPLFLSFRSPVAHDSLAQYKTRRGFGFVGYMI